MILGIYLQSVLCFAGPLPLAGPGSMAVHCTKSTAHCPQAVRQCIARSPLPTAPRQYRSALHEVHCPLPPGSMAVHCRNSTACCPRPVRECTAAIPLPTAPKQYGSALQELHCPMALGSQAVHCKNGTAHCPRAAVVDQSILLSNVTTESILGKIDQDPYNCHVVIFIYIVLFSSLRKIIFLNTHISIPYPFSVSILSKL